MGGILRDWGILGLSGSGFGYRSRSPEWHTPSGTGPLKLSELQEPSTTINVTDPASNGYSHNGQYAVGYSNSGYITVLHGGQVGPFSGGGSAPPMEGGGNYLFADGHVKWVSASQSYKNPMWNIEKN